MRTQWLLGLIALAAAPTASGQDKKDEPKVTPGQEQFQAIWKEWSQNRLDLTKSYRAAATSQEKDQIQGQLDALINKFSDRLFQIAQEYPTDPGAEDALALLSMQLGASEKTAEHGARALTLLVTNFPQSSKLAAPLGATQSVPIAAWEKPLRFVMENHPDQDRQAQACLMLAENLRLRSERAQQKKDAAGAALLQQAEDVLKEGQGKFKEAKSAKEFDDALFILHRLTVGATPPPIDGDDVLTAQPMKLGDYRGKVVVLYFFGDWCPPCRAMYSQQRALAKRMEGKPFALVGVNSDKNREEIKKVMENEQITWSCFWNGGGARGPIATAYRVRDWPTTFVLDSRGVIRYRNVRGAALDTAVDLLLMEMSMKQ
jgi:thiol-disulfide isomerase/thioredoxin